jgi:hypothetical protein
VFRGLLFVSGAVAMGVVLLAARALPVAAPRPRAAGPLAPPSRAESSRERLIEHALHAIAQGHGEQAVALLGRYQDSGPSTEHAVEVMLRVLKKDLATTVPPR